MEDHDGRITILEAGTGEEWHQIMEVSFVPWRLNTLGVAY